VRELNGFLVDLFVIGYPRNAVLEQRTRLWQNDAQAHAELNGEAVCVFTETQDYQAGS
jgi:hypothetical protein